MSDFAFLQLLTLNCSKMVKFGSISILPKLAGPLGLPSIQEYPKQKFFLKNLEPPLPDHGNPKSMVGSNMGL